MLQIDPAQAPTGLQRAPRPSNTADTLGALTVKIAIIANVGNANLGDEAILHGTLQALRSRLPDARIRVYTVNPTETRERHAVHTAPLRRRVKAWAPPAESRGHSDSLRAIVRRIPIVAPILHAGFRWARGAMELAREPAFIWRSWRHLRHTDLMLIAGSNQVEDWFGGPSGYPYTLLLWSALARTVGAPVAFVCVGAGPFHSRLSGWMCVRALRLATYVSFRDAGSLEVRRGLGYRGVASVVPDLAFALELEAPRPRPAGGPVRVAINVFPFRDPGYDPRAVEGDEDFVAYVDAMAGLISAARVRGLQPLLYGMQAADRRVLDLVQEALFAREPHLGPIERHLPSTLADIVAVIDGSDVVVATRYHGILLGVLRGRATVGVCYLEKSRRLLEMAGLGQYAVDAQGLDARVVLDRLLNAIEVGGTVPDIYARAKAMHVECGRGFDEALARCLPGLSVGFATSSGTAQEARAAIRPAEPVDDVDADEGRYYR